MTEPLITHVGGRDATCLSGPWNAIVDPFETGYYDYRGNPNPGGWFRHRRPRSPADLIEYDFERAGTLRVPGDWTSQRPELFFYEGTVWYQREFEAEPRPGRRVFLHVGAAEHRARVYLNGAVVGAHEGGFTPFQIELTGGLRAGRNDLVVKVDNQRRREGVPALDYDWWSYGGLTRDVLLLEVPETFVRAYALWLAPGGGARIEGRLGLDGPRAAQRVRVRIPDLRAEAAVETDADGRAAFSFDAPGLERWSPRAPRLYDVEVEAETDRVSDRIGFRSVETRGGEILLNGEPLFLRGASLHGEALGREGRACGDADARALLERALELGCNFVRLAHYPHDEAMTRAADELGLLVWAEIPVYWRIDFESSEALGGARRQLAEMIDRDRNRASVILWSVGNETPPGPARNAFLERLARDARELDPTRLVTAALEMHGTGDHRTLVIDDPLGASLDVLACNEYLGWYLGGPEVMDRIVWTTPYDKPLIMSELGAGALQGRRGPREERWTEDHQAHVYECQIAMLRRIPFLRGLTPWILKDFRSPKRPLAGVQDYWNRKGLLSERGVPKAAFFVLQRFYREIEARERDGEASAAGPRA